MNRQMNTHVTHDTHVYFVEKINRSVRGKIFLSVFPLIFAELTGNMKEEFRQALLVRHSSMIIMYLSFFILYATFYWNKFYPTTLY